MRWWMTLDSPCIMSVDNASVAGMDFSELVIDNPDLWMVNWEDGKGEIENQEVIDGARGDKNLNGLREDFFDVTPYAPLFQQFLERMKAKALLLNQAKKIQIDLIKQLYESKRQLPYHYPVAAGDYWWDASDSGVSSVIPSVSGTISSLNNVIANLNSLVVAINGHISLVNGLSNEINSDIVNYANSGFIIIDSITAHLAAAGNSNEAHLNNVVLGTSGAGGNTVNNTLQTGTIPAGEASVSAARPGLLGNIPPATYDWYAVSPTNPYRCQPINSSFPAISWSPLPPVSVPTSNWVPIGLDHAVPVTPQESAAIINGISARTQQLQIVRNDKISDVNALTDIDDVIAYDVLADWPVIVVPPGYKLEPPTHAPSGVTVVGTPGAPSEGVPEAPSDGVTYGRRNHVWNPALALSGDVLDGGSF